MYPIMNMPNDTSISFLCAVEEVKTRNSENSFSYVVISRIQYLNPSRYDCTLNTQLACANVGNCSVPISVVPKSNDALALDAGQAVVKLRRSAEL